MIYFFFNLCLHLLVSVFLLLLLMRFVSNNQKRKNRKGISYLLPVAVTVLFLFQVLTITAPRIMDSIYVLKQNYQTASGTVESVGYLNHAFVIDGETYYYNPFMYWPHAGDYYEISYTPYAQYVAEFSLAKS